MDYSVFDSLIDSVFVINEEKKIIYCNNAAATMCESSIRRLSKAVPIYSVLEFSDKQLWCTETGEVGRDEAAPLSEIDFKVLSSGVQGKVQISIQPFLEGEGLKRWVVITHDVTLEETLHTKYHGELKQKEDFINQLQDAKEQLENYSKNLEKMVEERTAQVNQANRMLKAIMNSLGQGFLVFDEEGLCGDIYTKACETILESNPQGQRITEVLKLQEADTDQFKMWAKAAFSESLPFESMKDLAPTQFSSSTGKHVTLDYYPIRNEEESISNLVLVATDRTAEFEANLALEREREHARMVIKLVTNKDQFQDFMSSLDKNISETKELLVHSRPESLDHEKAFRLLHTIEGEAGAFAALEIRKVAREAQEALEPYKWEEAAKYSDTFIRLGECLKKLEQAKLNFLEQNQPIFEALGFGREQVLEVPKKNIEQFWDLLKKSKVSPVLSTAFVDRFLKTPFQQMLKHYNDVLKTIAEAEGKKIAPIEFQGEVRVFKDQFSELAGVLVHAFRNAADHGVETPDLRLERGKPEEAKIVVRFEEFSKEAGLWFRISITDDGGGIDPAVIRKKAKEKIAGLDVESLSDEEVLQVIFHPGFSSREGIGEFSGRGVGMDAVLTEAKRLGGKAFVTSQKGKGTKLVVEVPLEDVVWFKAAGA